MTNNKKFVIGQKVSPTTLNMVWGKHLAFTWVFDFTLEKPGIDGMANGKIMLTWEYEERASND